MKVRYIDYYKAKSRVFLYELENTALRYGKRNIGQWYLLQYIFSPRLYNSIKIYLDRIKNLENKRFPLGENIYSLEDIKYINLDDIKSIRNLGNKQYSEFVEWHAFVNNIK